MRYTKIERKNSYKISSSINPLKSIMTEAECDGVDSFWLKQLTSLHPELQAYHMHTNYLQGPVLHHYRKGLHLSGKQQPAPKVQKGCCSTSCGCKNQLLINKAILEEVRYMRRNLSTTWIDYKKTFDSVPHTWIVKSLELYKICPTMTRFMRENDKTIFHLNHNKGMMTSRPIEIKSGIYQGDSLSPLVLLLLL